jgi:hypothetical protein
MGAEAIPMRGGLASSSNPPELHKVQGGMENASPIPSSSISCLKVPGPVISPEPQTESPTPLGMKNISRLTSGSISCLKVPGPLSPQPGTGGEDGTSGVTIICCDFVVWLFKIVGALIFMIIAIPIGIRQWAVSGNASGSSPTKFINESRTLRTDSEKVKAGWITMVILVIVGVAAGLPCGLDKCKDPTDSSTGAQPTEGGSGDGGQKPPMKTPGGIAHACQPNFGGAALSVNGSDVEWGISGDTVIAQIFDPLVPEFYFYFTGAPTNLYNIQYVCLSPCLGLA